MSEHTENSFYSLLVGISQDVGEIKSDIKNLKTDVREVQDNVDKYNTESRLSDKEVTAKLEEYFILAKDRQDTIKEELESEIKTIDTKFSEEITGLKGRIDLIEDTPKTKIYTWFIKAKDYVIWAIILACIGYGMKFMADLTKTVHSQVTTEQSR